MVVPGVDGTVGSGFDSLKVEHGGGWAAASISVG